MALRVEKVASRMPVIEATSSFTPRTINNGTKIAPGLVPANETENELINAPTRSFATFLRLGTMSPG